MPSCLIHGPGAIRACVLWTGNVSAQQGKQLGCGVNPLFRKQTGQPRDSASELGQGSTIKKSPIQKGELHMGQDHMFSHIPLARTRAHGQLVTWYHIDIEGAGKCSPGENFLEEKESSGFTGQ